MVWLIGGLPATAVVAGLTTVMIAAHDPDSLVSDEPDKQGMTVTESRTPADLRAGELGISASLRINASQLIVNLKGSLEPMPAKLLLTIIHPTLPDQDRTVTLTGTGGGGYVVALAGDFSGKREYMLNNLTWLFWSRPVK